jgi:hypothetical protein
MPNEVTPPITLLLPMKFGPPKSPMQVPPEAWLFDSRIEKSPEVRERDFQLVCEHQGEHDSQ